MKEAGEGQRKRSAGAGALPGHGAPDYYAGF